MNNNLNFNDIICKLNKSPIREILKNNDVTIFEEERSILKEIENIIEANKKNSETELKIVILGEVKAGKSTLINTLVGKKVSYTNVIEATAIILEVGYGKELVAKINYVNGSEKNFLSLEELDSELYGKEEGQEFFNNINNITVKTPTMLLRNLTIVDTPGVNTVTKENAIRTSKYIENADIVLWVLNGHHLGQSDITNKIQDVLEFGKPIIAIINKIDEISAEKEEIIEYVEDEMGYMFKNIIAISAKEAWDGKVYDDSEKYKNSNIEELIEYISNNIESEAKKVQLNSIIESSKFQIERDLRIHEKARFRIKELLRDLEIKNRELSDINKNIKNIVEDKLNYWLEMEFLNKEIGFLENIRNEYEFNEKVKYYTSDDYMNSIVNTKYNELADYVNREWKNNSEKMIKEQKRELTLALKYGEDLVGSNNENRNDNEIVDGAKKGAITGGAIGLGLAGYAAWLGPAAAYVTTGAALGAILPPVLIISTIGGAILKVTTGDNRKKDRISKLNMLKYDIERLIKQNVIKNMRDNLWSISDIHEENSKKLLEDIILQCNISKEDLESTKVKLDSYLSN